MDDISFFEIGEYVVPENTGEARWHFERAWKQQQWSGYFKSWEEFLEEGFEIRSIEYELKLYFLETHESKYGFFVPIYCCKFAY